MKILIVLAAMAVALYGKAQCCCNNSDDPSVVQRYCCITYDACNTRAIQWKQYNNNFTKTCLAVDGVMQFINATKSLINELRFIILKIAPSSITQNF